MHSKNKSIFLSVVIILAILLSAGTIWAQTKNPCVHGIMDRAKGICVCEKGWTGPDCSKQTRLPDSPCVHGIMDRTKRMCVCQKGWTGGDCSQAVKQPTTAR